ncbi:MAG: hypothetical protein NXI07_15175, partial [bacterium]|nr:hypothetical protein [bacterium]
MALVLVLTVVVAGATSAILGYVIRVQNDVDMLYTREASYASNRLRYELSRFEMSVKSAMYDEQEPLAGGDHHLGYDIVWNRLDVIGRATLYATMPGFESERRVIQQFAAMHRAAE